MNLDKLLKKSHLASLSTENHWISLINGMGKGNLPWWGARFYPERDLNSSLKEWTKHCLLGISLSGRFLPPVPEEFLAGCWKWSAWWWEALSWHQIFWGGNWNFSFSPDWNVWESHLEFFSLIEFRIQFPAQEQIPPWRQSQAWSMEFIFQPCLCWNLGNLHPRPGLMTPIPGFLSQAWWNWIFSPFF